VSDSDLHLRNQLCFALYRATRLIQQIYRPLLDELGLTYPQYLVMLVLWERGTVTLKELGAELDLDSGTLSPLVKRLKAAGLVTTGRRAEDERSVEIALTGKGRSLRERARDIPAKIGCATQMQLEDIVALRTALGELADSLAESHTAMAAAR
jgi:DNA-binding MarR family transcriptional regulator